jgi:ribosomal protein L4
MTTMEDVLLAFVLTTTLIGVPVIAFTASRIFKQWLAFKERQLAAQSLLATQRTEQRLASVDDLQLRVQVLERIATDRTSRLAAEIEDLRQPSTN